MWKILFYVPFISKVNAAERNKRYGCTAKTWNLKYMYFAIVKKKDLYGYDMIKILQKYFKDTDESTLYAILRRLHKEGLTNLYYSERSHGPKRKYYKITEKGEECLKQYIASWHEIEQIFDELGL